MRKALGMFVVLLPFAGSQIAFACWPSPASAALITANGQTARFFGWLGLILAILVGGFGFLRGKIGLAAKFLMGLPFVLVTLSPGWRYSGLHGDCGKMEAVFAKQLVACISFLLIWQIALSMRHFWHQKFSR